MNYTNNFKTHTNYFPTISSRRFYEFFNILNCKIFLETGTFNGNGVDWAISKNHYEQIYSIEIDLEKYNLCSNKFKNNKNVKIIHDSSENYLNYIVPTLKSPTLVYLDAHFDGYYPIINESNILLNNFYNLNDLIVCIDDERLFSENLKQEVVNLYKLKNFTDCYLDDSIIFCKNHWIKNI